MVVYHHTLSISESVSYGYQAFDVRHLKDLLATGVDIFFVISGFIIAATGPLAERAMTARRFL